MLGQPAGIFSLNNSDKCVGSFLTQLDIDALIPTLKESYSKLKFSEVDGALVIDENLLSAFWYKSLKASAPKVTKASFDELILRHLIKRVYPNAVIETQVRVKRFAMDLKVTVNNQTLFVEFDGPTHFVNSRYGDPKHDPFRKKFIVEDLLGVEVVNWPYWIQRCEQNVKALFDISIIGLGALWSTEAYFGKHIFLNSAEIIEKMTARFNAAQEGYGYMYEADSKGRVKPEHPVIQRILENKRIDLLIPPGDIKSKEWWLPKSLHTLL